jgi:hypothetical protein
MVEHALSVSETMSSIPSTNKQMVIHLFFIDMFLHLKNEAAERQTEKESSKNRYFSVHTRVD